MKANCLALPILLSGLLIAGCDKKAEGQVAAVVNGDEITLQEVNAELGGQSVPEGTQGAQLRKAALERIIQRRLLAQSAREEGLDKSPEYIVRQRAINDALLVQLLGRKIGATIKIPDQREIKSYIDTHPSTFEQREILTIDRVQFSSAKGEGLIKQLEGAHSMNEIIGILDANGVKYGRATSEVDTARISQDFAKQIVALPAGEPFLVPEGSTITAGVVTGKRTSPIAGDAASPLAANAYRQQQLDTAIRQRLEAAQAKAKIEYQSGFAPEKPPTK